MTAYQQHKSVLLDDNVDECPRQNILSALSIQIQQWQADNCSIIIAGDFNDDVSGNTIKSFFQQLNLHEVILQQHGNDAPNTMIQGSKPTDGIFCSDNVTPIRSGYMPFDWGMATDHRLLWIDIDMHQLLGTTTPPLWKPKARRLQCNNPIIVKQFNKLRKEYMQRNNSQDIHQTLITTLHNNHTAEWKTLFEQFDTIRTNSVKHADRHCRKLKMGQIPWSPEIQQAMANITYLQRCRLKYINGYQINIRTLYKAYSKTNYDTHFDNPDQIIHQLKQEFKHYNVLKRQASQLRYNFLSNLAEAQSLDSSKAKEKIYQQLQMNESIRNVFRKIKYSIKDLRSGVTMVEAPCEDGSWRVVTDKIDIEQECIKENIQRLTQAGTTPPMLQDQIQLLGSKANTNLAEQILQGNITNTTGIHPDIVNMIPFLNIPDKIKDLMPIRDTITGEEYKTLWHRSKEQTSCGISGLHFGHFIASCQDNQLCEIDRWFMQTSLSTGQTLNRWRNGIDVMIPKKIDSHRVDKLRTIVLMEPDFNFINKIIGKRVMALAERAGSVAPEQFGSRKQKSAIIHAVNKQLTTDILRQDKQNFCLIILDAKACYDRITPMYASFAMKRQGATNNMINLMFDTIEQMTHFIRTSYGDSTNNYTQGSTKFHGILQGNGAGPTIWAMISSTILDKLRSEGLGVKIDTLNGTILTIPAFAFVDDTDLLQQIQNDDITAPQKAVTAWSSGLRTTGGLIVPEKCSFQMVKHIWKNNRWVIDDDIDNRIQVTIPNEAGIPIPIRQSSAKSGEVALGIAFSPIANMTDEIIHLRQKTTKWAEKISKSNLTSYEAWTALKTTVFKTIEYALPTTLLTRKQLQYITAPAINIGLAKAGICRKISRTIIYAPNKYQGFGLKDPFITQGICKLQLLLNPYNELTSKLIDASWHRSVVECGIGPQMLQYQFNTYKHIITPGWIANLWEFLSESNIQVQQEQTQYPFRMQNDDYINKQVFAHKWTPSEKSNFNNCRLYLQVELLSDIITANGLKIRKNILKGQKDITNLTTVSWKVPIPNITSGAWKDWQKMITYTYKIDTQGYLHQPLSAINNPINWQWFLQPSTNRIIRKLDNQWQIYTHHSGRTRNQQYRYNCTIPPDHSYITPITTYQTGDVIQIDGIGSHQPLRKSARIDWGDTIQHHLVGDINVLLQHSVTEAIIILSDATVQSDGSYAAWIVATSNSYGMGTYISGYGRIFEDNTDSHRAECFGILGGITTYQHYKEKYNISSTIPVILVCDNKSAINYTGNLNRYQQITSNIPDFDVLNAIRSKLAKEIFTYQHVKGHQDRSSKPWTIFTTINIHVDLLASEAGDRWQQLPIQPTGYQHLFQEKWQIRLNDHKLYKQLDENIRNGIAEQTVPSVWHRYHRVEQTWFQEVNWDAIQHAMKASPITTRQWILKRCVRDCGAHAILLRRKERTDDFCPMCGLSETVIHVYTCQHRKVTTLWEKISREFHQYLESIYTAPTIIEQLTLGITHWRNNQVMPNNPMIIDQSQIGWNGILEGIMGRHWEEEQDYFSTQNELYMKGRKWASLVIRKLWQIAWELWENRNLEAHQNDQDNILEGLKQQVREEQIKGDQGYIVLQRLLDIHKVDKVLKGNVSYIHCWLRNIQARRNRLVRLQEHSPAYIQMQNTLRQFLNNN